MGAIEQSKDLSVQSNKDGSLIQTDDVSGAMVSSPSRKFYSKLKDIPFGNSSGNSLKSTGLMVSGYNVHSQGVL